MSLGERIIQAIEKRRDRKRRSQPGAIGQFWRDGGNSLLYELPVTANSVIIDAGGYKGEWTAEMIARYGCRSMLYEPVPAFADHCNKFFSKNQLVHVHAAALGGSDRITTFYLLDNGTSEFRVEDSQQVEAKVVDVARVFDELAGERVACLKLNIEGGEYEVLERMLETGKTALCDSLLIQFHRQPAGYEDRYFQIFDALQSTHTQSWCYEMVWEKWVLNVGMG
jgi:FkbM family methyltransferase